MRFFFDNGDFIDKSVNRLIGESNFKGEMRRIDD